MIADIELPSTVSKGQARAAERSFMEEVQTDDRCFSMQGENLVTHRGGFEIVIQGVWEQGFLFIDADLGIVVPEDEDVMVEMRTYLAYAEAFRYKHAETYTTGGERLMTQRRFRAGERVHLRWTPRVDAWDLDDLTCLPAQTAKQLKGDLVQIASGKSAAEVVSGKGGGRTGLGELFQRLHELSD